MLPAAPTTAAVSLVRSMPWRAQPCSMASSPMPMVRALPEVSATSGICRDWQLLVTIEVYIPSPAMRQPSARASRMRAAISSRIGCRSPLAMYPAIALESMHSG
ncbi:hypothetical protein D3C78_1461690 [compost metagenome]